MTGNLKGFHINSNLGIKVNAAKIAIPLAMVVNRPKRMLGVKFDNIRIEKPAHTTSVV